MSEVLVRGQDVGDPEFHHNCHRRKIGKRYSWFVRGLFPQSDRSGKSGPGDLLYINERGPHDICREMPCILEWPALEQECKCLVQDEIRCDGAAGAAGLPEDFSGSSVAGVPLVGDGNPAPCINKKLHAGSLPYNSSSIFWDNVPSEMDPITLRNGSGISFMIAISFPNVRGPKTPFFTALRNSSTNFSSSMTR